MATFLFEGKRIHYLDKGKGMPVLLLHAFGLDSSAYTEFIEPIAANYRFIIPDLPGTGLSEPLQDYSMAVLAELYNALRKKLNISAWAVAGHSIGGYIALEMLHKYPSSVTQLMLMHSHCYPDSKEKKAARTRQIAFVQSHDLSLFIKELIGNLFSRDYVLLHKFQIDSLIHKASRFTKTGVAGLLAAMRDRHDRSATLEASKIPIGFILSTEDKAIPVEQSLSQIRLPARASVAFPPGSTHMSIFESTPAARKALDTFLKTSYKVYN